MLYNSISSNKISRNFGNKINLQLNFIYYYYIFVIMKKFLCIMILIPSVSFAQVSFEQNRQVVVPGQRPLVQNQFQGNGQVMVPNQPQLQRQPLPYSGNLSFDQPRSHNMPSNQYNYQYNPNFNPNRNQQNFTNSPPPPVFNNLNFGNTTQGNPQTGFNNNFQDYGERRNGGVPFGWQGAGMRSQRATTSLFPGQGVMGSNQNGMAGFNR